MFEDIVETAREPLLVLDSVLRVLLANRSFYDSFKVTPEETIGNRGLGQVSLRKEVVIRHLGGYHK